MVPAGFDSRQRPFILTPGSHGYREERKDMKKKSSYIAVQVTENGKNYAYAVKVSESDNLLSKLAIKDITAATFAARKKKPKKLLQLGTKVSKITVHLCSGRCSTNE